MTSNGKTAPTATAGSSSTSSRSRPINPDMIDRPSNPIRYPTPRTEPNIFVKLFGMNEVPYMELWGWTHAIPVGFPMLKPNLVMEKVTMPPGGGLPEKLETLHDLSRTLKSYENSASLGYERIVCPIFVQVIAKKKVDIIAMKDKKNDAAPCTVLAIGTLIVADSTGACILTLFNETVGIIHEEVCVGDYLVISKGSFQEPPPNRQNSANPFHKELLKLEIKIDKYQVRHIFHVVFKTYSKVKLPAIDLFHCDDRLWFPSEVLNDPAFKVYRLQNQTPSLENKNNYHERQKRKQKYFDVCGFVSYVGMVERRVAYEEQFICFEKTTDEEGEDIISSTSFQIPIRQFNAFRWVQLVDKCSSEPLLVKVYFNKDGISLQRKLVPGALVVLSHCQLSNISFMEDFVNTTIFTSIYTHEELPSVYFKLVPQSFILSAATYISESASKQVFERADIIWSAGGTIQPKIKSPGEFLEHFHLMEVSNLEKGEKFVPNNLRFDRRESFMIYFRGKIEGVQEISENNGLDREKYEELREFVLGTDDSLRLREDKWQVYKDAYSTNSRGGGNWFSHRRRLPQFKSPSSGSTRKMVEEVTNFYDKYCTPLLLPCVYPTVPENEPTPLSTCQKLGEPTYYRVIIKDEGSEKWYDALWRNFPAETMKRKWTAAKGKIIVGLIDLHHLERGWGFDLALRDFVIEEDS